MKISHVSKALVVTGEAIVIIAIFVFCAAFVGGCGSVSMESTGVDAGTGGAQAVSSAGTGGMVKDHGFGGAPGTGGIVSSATGGAGGSDATGGVGGQAIAATGGAGGSIDAGAPCLPDPWFLDTSSQQLGSEVALDRAYAASPMASALTSYQVASQGFMVIQGTFAFNRTNQVDATGEDKGAAATGQVWVQVGSCGAGQVLTGKTVSFSAAGNATPQLDLFVRLYFATVNADHTISIVDPGFPEMELNPAYPVQKPNFIGTVTKQIDAAIGSGADSVSYLVVEVRERLNSGQGYSATGDGAFTLDLGNIYVGSNTAL